MRVDFSDAELVAALNEGRPEAFRTAWQRFSPLVGGVLRRTLGSDELEDVKQEVFSCLFRRVATLRDPLALRPFVLAITLNTVKHERRRRRRRAHVALMPDWAELQVPGRDQPASHLACMRLAGLVRRLIERERTAFVFRFIQGMTVPQVALALNVSEPTARRYFSRAWARIQKWAARDPFLNDYLQGKRLGPPADDSWQDDEGESEYPTPSAAAMAAGPDYPTLRDSFPTFRSAGQRQPNRGAVPAF